MREIQFQSLEHRLGAMVVHSRGESLALGYTPDLTASLEGDLRLIIENEPRSDLKAVIGCYQRAEKYCRDARATPSLVIITAGKGRIGVRVAADRLREYAQFWKSVNPPGAVSEVLLLSDRDYSETVRRRIPVLSAGFRALCLAIPLESRVTGVSPVINAQAPQPARRPDPESLRARGGALRLTA